MTHRHRAAADKRALQRGSKIREEFPPTAEPAPSDVERVAQVIVDALKAGSVNVHGDCYAVGDTSSLEVDGEISPRAVAKAALATLHPNKAVSAACEECENLKHDLKRAMDRANHYMNKAVSAPRAGSAGDVGELVVEWRNMKLGVHSGRSITAIADDMADTLQRYAAALEEIAAPSFERRDLSRISRTALGQTSRTDAARSPSSPD